MYIRQTPNNKYFFKQPTTKYIITINDSAFTYSFLYWKKSLVTSEKLLSNLHIMYLISGEGTKETQENRQLNRFGHLYQMDEDREPRIVSESQNNMETYSGRPWVTWLNKYPGSVNREAISAIKASEEAGTVGLHETPSR